VGFLLHLERGVLPPGRNRPTPQPKERPITFWTFLVWLILAAEGWPEGGRSAFYEGFEGPEVSWQQAGADTPHRIEFHARIQGEAHVGQGCERLRLAAGHGSYVYLAHPIGRAPVIDELLVSLWVKSDRAGVRLLAQVVFPRTRHPQTGAPLTALITGTSYTQLGRWEQLRLQDVPQQVARQVRVLRSQYGPQIDEREAYISHVVLNIYGGPGVTNLWIDDLDVAGVIQSQPIAKIFPPSAEPTGSNSAGSLGMGTPSIHSGGPLHSGGPMISAGPSLPLGETIGEQPAPRLVGSVFMVQGREFFPRIISYQGESLAFLQNLGFNVVWLPSPPGPELLGQAEQLGMWFICPPPISPDPIREGESSTLSGIREKIPPDFDRVLAWDVTLTPVSSQLDRIAQWADKVRRAESRAARPLVCRAEGNFQALSRVVDILWLIRPPIGAGLELADYTRWIRQRELLVRPGTPLWVSIPTQLPPAIRAQWMQFSSGRQIPDHLSPEQIRLALYSGLAGGVRGVVYESDRALDAQDSETQTRAAALELLNREMEILEPWLAAGTGVGGGRTSQPEVQTALLRTERARLALLFWTGPAASYVVGQAAAQQMNFTLPGLPETHEAYQILGGTLRPLRRDRTAGGVRVTLEEFDLTAAVVLSQDTLAISATTRRAQTVERRLAELHHQLALQKLQEVQTVLNRLPSGLLEGQTPSVVSQINQGLGQAREQLTFCSQRLQTREYVAAVLAAQRAQRAQRLSERRIWESAVGGVEATVIWPLAGCFRMLPEHLEMTRRVRYSAAGPNLLAGSDFEDLQTMLAAGWRNGQGGSETADGAVELAQEAARSGRYGLRLVAVPRQRESPPEVIDSPPVWVISPPIRVQPGQYLHIQGWVQIPQPIQGSVDGLVITDSIGGECLAWRIQKTSDWQPFEMYRVVGQPGTLQIRFVLTGLGEARLDDIVIQPVIPAVTGAGVFPGLGENNSR